MQCQGTTIKGKQCKYEGVINNFCIHHHWKQNETKDSRKQRSETLLQPL